MGGAIIALLAVLLFVALILFRLIEVTFIRLGRARLRRFRRSERRRITARRSHLRPRTPRTGHYFENHQPSWFDRARDEHRSLSWRDPAQCGRSNICVISAWRSHT